MLIATAIRLHVILQRNICLSIAHRPSRSFVVHLIREKKIVVIYSITFSKNTEQENENE